MAENRGQDAALAAANAALALMGMLNAEANHEVDLEITPLPEASTADDAVRLHYARSAQPAYLERHLIDTWSITTAVVPGGLDEAFAPILADWMFGPDWSPRFGTLAPWARQQAVEHLLGLIRATTGEAEVRRLTIAPEPLAAAYSEQLVLSGRSQRWLVDAAIYD